MSTTGADVPAPLVRAFLEELTGEGPDLERRWFLRQVAESAVGPLPPTGPGDASRGPGAMGTPIAAAETLVAVGDAVALAVAVLDPFDADPPEPAAPEPAAVPTPEPVLDGRSAARELARRARRQVGQRVGEPLRRRVGRR